MKAYDYEIKGNAEALRDIEETIKSKNVRINWKNFSTGDNYFTGDGNAYKVTIDHKTKTVELTER